MPRSLRCRDSVCVSRTSSVTMGQQARELLIQVGQLPVGHEPWRACRGKAAR